MKQYAERGYDDNEELCRLYMFHLEAMTTEHLHLKSDIAWELAYRDSRIAELEKKLQTKDLNESTFRPASS